MNGLLTAVAGAAGGALITILLPRILDRLKRNRAIRIDTYPYGIGREGFIEHDGEVQIFNDSGVQQQIHRTWIDLRVPKRERFTDLVAAWYENKPPQVVEAGKATKNVVHVQSLVDVLTETPTTDQACTYRVGLQLGTGRRVRSKWVELPPRTVAYGGGNTPPD